MGIGHIAPRADHETEHLLRSGTSARAAQKIEGAQTFRIDNVLESGLPDMQIGNAEARPVGIPPSCDLRQRVLAARTGRTNEHAVLSFLFAAHHPVDDRFPGLRRSEMPDRATRWRGKAFDDDR